MREAAGDSYIVTPLESWMVMMSKEFCTSARKRASPSCKMSVLRRSRGERSKGPARTTSPASPFRAGDRRVFRSSSDTPPNKARVRTVDDSGSDTFILGTQYYDLFILHFFKQFQCGVPLWMNRGRQSGAFQAIWTPKGSIPRV